MYSFDWQPSVLVSFSDIQERLFHMTINHPVHTHFYQTDPSTADTSNANHAIAAALGEMSANPVRLCHMETDLHFASRFVSMLTTVKNKREREENEREIDQNSFHPASHVIVLIQSISWFARMTSPSIQI